MEEFRPYLKLLARLHLDPRVRGQVDPSDIVQQPFLAAHAKQAQFRGATDAERAAWLRAILANHLALALRKFGPKGGGRVRSLQDDLDRAILERLVRGNPAVTEYQSQLALNHNNIGSFLRETGKPTEALAAYMQAREIFERLVLEHPESPDYASNLGGQALNNLALIDLNAKRFKQTGERAAKAIIWQKKALSASPRDPTYRRFLRNHLTILMKAATARGNADEFVAAQRQRDELDSADPAKVALDVRLNSVLRGEAVKTNASSDSNSLITGSAPQGATGPRLGCLLRLWSASRCWQTIAGGRTRITPRAPLHSPPL